MKKDLVFTPILFVIGVFLFLFRVTDLTAHIVISVVGVAVLVAYTVLAKKEWKLPALEIVMRACYGIALLSGVIINISYVTALAILHKLFAVLFVVALIVLLTHKLATGKKDQ